MTIIDLITILAEIELCDCVGNPKDLREHLHQYASEILRDKEAYVLLQVESEVTFFNNLRYLVPFR